LESKIPSPYRELENFHAASKPKSTKDRIKQIGQPVDGNHHLMIMVNACPKCSASNYLAIHESTLKEDSEDSDTRLKIGWLTVNEAVVERVQMRVSSSDREAIRDGLSE